MRSMQKKKTKTKNPQDVDLSETFSREWLGRQYSYSGTIRLIL